jgi:predicted glycosyltransferase
MIDYEFVSGLTLMRPTWVMLPGSIPDQAVGLNPNQILRYPGIKEDIYVPGFSPDRKIRSALGVAEEDILVTLRPPANEAHYHNPESEVLLDAVLELLRKEESTRIVLLPRNARQGEGIRNAWPDMFKSGKIIVPSHAVDGLSLIWQSDLVISGGGTMNREAAALGVPVYSIFRGRIGAVDRHLADTKRLVLIEKVKDVQEKIDLRRRDRNGKKDFGTDSTRAQIIRNIERALAPKSTSKNRYL